MSYASAQSSDSWYTLFGPLSQPVIHLGESFFVDVDGYFNISDDEYITAEKLLKDDAIVIDDIETRTLVPKKKKKSAYRRFTVIKSSKKKYMNAM